MAGSLYSRHQWALSRRRPPVESLPRGGRLILIGDARLAHDFANEAAATIVIQDVAPEFAAMVYAVPVQLIAYHTAVVMGKDADQPRNLAKSVTVE
jgi:glutamine---fructose-6-phosphate transaminase (isomerizing)